MVCVCMVVWQGQSSREAQPRAAAAHILKTSAVTGNWGVRGRRKEIVSRIGQFHYFRNFMETCLAHDFLAYYLNVFVNQITYQRQNF